MTSRSRLRRLQMKSLNRSCNAKQSRSSIFKVRLRLIWDSKIGYAASATVLKNVAYPGSAQCAEKMSSALEHHLSKLSNKSVGESSQITWLSHPRYALTSMLWNSRQ